MVSEEKFVGDFSVVSNNEKNPSFFSQKILYLLRIIKPAIKQLRYGKFTQGCEF
jgi:hypothetical protein